MTSTLLGTHGSTASPIACPGFTVTGYSISLPELTSSDDLNDLKVRVYAKSTLGGKIHFDRATVTGAAYNAFTLYTRLLGDQSTTSLTTIPWEIATAGDGAFFQNNGNWSNAFASGRYVKLTFPALTPSSATVTGGTFDFSYRPNTNGDSACYYFEVYSGTTCSRDTRQHLVARLLQHSNSAYVTDAVSLTEVNTSAIANSLVVKIYSRTPVQGLSSSIWSTSR